MQRQTRYAKSGRVSVAFQVLGDASVDLILVPGFVSHLEVAWEEPRLAHFLGRLASFARLIVFDKRGTGMSDPVDRPPSMDERMDDIRAVMDATGSERGTLFGISEGGTLSLLFAHAHPDRAKALVLYGSWARRLAGPGLPVRPVGRAARGDDPRDGPGLGVGRLVGRRSAQPRRRCPAPRLVGPVPADGGQPGDGAEPDPDEHGDGHP